MTNQLNEATSPYLLQHADNPVHWWEWSPEALALAKAEDKPIFLSVGYAACHWCHVMAHESFEDTNIAAILNEYFVSIKVDREERPDIDSIYMDAVVAITGQGGWPMTMFLTPSGEPFYGGTYFPPSERYGMPSFKRVLTSVIDAWENRRDQVDANAANMRERLAQTNQLEPQAGELSTDLLDAAFDQLYQYYDDHEGGFGSAPKFPQPMSLEFLLRQHMRTGASAPLAMVTHTLRKMANGGMYDQLGGGFHRYSTDAYWLVPHFEKMLYDNALLARVYLYTWQITGDSFFKRIVEETLDYVLREMTDSTGGFYSTQDADSEGTEGKFFVWGVDEVKSLLGEEDGTLFCRYYDVTPYGNFEGANILHVDEDIETVAEAMETSPDRLRLVLDRGRERLFAEREKRIKPGLDDKVLAAWNGLMMQTMAEAGAALNRPDYLNAAILNAQFIGDEMLDGRGRLHRSWKEGRATLNGYLEDYTVVAEGLVALYQATFESQWLTEAERLLRMVHVHFWDDEKGGAFHISDDHEQLIVRRKDFVDNAEPSGNSAYATAAMRIGRLLENYEYAERSESVFRIMRHSMATQPSGFGHLLSALDFYIRPSREIAIVGDPDDSATKVLTRTIYEQWLPDTIMAGIDPGRDDGSPRFPLLEGRTLVNGQPAAYVCRNFVCNLPVTKPEMLAEQLGR